jgi:hypothetical protein
MDFGGLWERLNKLTNDEHFWIIALLIFFGWGLARVERQVNRLEHIAKILRRFQSEWRKEHGIPDYVSQEDIALREKPWQETLKETIVLPILLLLSVIFIGGIGYALLHPKETERFLTENEQAKQVIGLIMTVFLYGIPVFGFFVFVRMCFLWWTGRWSEVKTDPGGDY